MKGSNPLPPASVRPKPPHNPPSLACAASICGCCEEVERLTAEVTGLRETLRRRGKSVLSEVVALRSERDRKQAQLDTIFRLALDALSAAGSGPEYTALNAIYWHAKGVAEPVSGRQSS